ncbi:MAG: enoyl-CoA hydratase/isomerase family protein [Pseudomonadales bacterium]|nr:enoyl-CoA hydratase/isomerase family protein [Pseudomonadales bacterium]MBO7005867.1 enoyl-CoA hydratase/isomerase family protein [Pseudomonadales bacterium]
MNYTDIEYEVRGSAAIITLNRPETLNALTYHTLREIRSAVDLSVDDPDVVGIIFTGKGRGFSSGLDAQVLASVTSGEESGNASTRQDNELPGLFSYLLEVPKPVITAMNGIAAGGGLILALMSDIRFASSDAAITTVFLKRGLIAEHGSSWILPRLVGTGRALDLLWASDKVSAEEALELGLVDRVSDPEALIDDAVAYIDKLAVTSAPAAIAATKKLVYDHLGVGFREALIEADKVQNEFVAKPDAKEGAMALIEKRAPNFERLGKSID